MSYKYWEPTETATLKENAHLPMDELVKILKVTNRQIRSHARTKGITLTGPLKKSSPDEMSSKVKECRKLLMQGRTIRDARTISGVSESTAYRVLNAIKDNKESHLPIPNSTPVKTKKNSLSLSEENLSKLNSVFS